MTDKALVGALRWNGQRVDGTADGRAADVEHTRVDRRERYVRATSAA
jgi:hypothetical protein